MASQARVATPVSITLRPRSSNSSVPVWGSSQAAASLRRRADEVSTAIATATLGLRFRRSAKGSLPAPRPSKSSRSSAIWNASPRWFPARASRSASSGRSASSPTPRPHRANSAPVLPSAIWNQRSGLSSTWPRAPASRRVARVIAATVSRAAWCSAAGCPRISPRARVSNRSPERTDVRFPHTALAVGRPRRRVPSSTTSSCSRLAAWIISTQTARSHRGPAGSAKVSPSNMVNQGRARLPPAWTRWRAASIRASVRASSTSGSTRTTSSRRSSTWRRNVRRCGVSTDGDGVVGPASSRPIGPPSIPTSSPAPPHGDPAIGSVGS